MFSVNANIGIGPSQKTPKGFVVVGWGGCIKAKGFGGCSLTILLSRESRVEVDATKVRNIDPQPIVSSVVV